MVRAYCIQIISRVDCKEDKTLKTKEQMTDMERTEIVQESMDGIKCAERGGHW
jgi:nitrogenase subunit NifH